MAFTVSEVRLNVRFIAPAGWPLEVLSGGRAFCMLVSYQSSLL
jgi:hypothetical protein